MYKRQVSLAGAGRRQAPSAERPLRRGLARILIAFSGPRRSLSSSLCLPLRVFPYPCFLRVTAVGNLLPKALALGVKVTVKIVSFAGSRGSGFLWTLRSKISGKLSQLPRKDPLGLSY